MASVVAEAGRVAAAVKDATRAATTVRPEAYLGTAAEAELGSWAGMVAKVGAELAKVEATAVAGMAIA